MIMTVDVFCFRISIFTILERLKLCVYVFSSFKILTTLFYSTKDSMPRARTPPMFTISRICFDRYKLAVCFINRRTCNRINAQSYLRKMFFRDNKFWDIVILQRNPLITTKANVVQKRYSKEIAGCVKTLITALENIKGSLRFRQPEKTKVFVIVNEN